MKAVLDQINVTHFLSCNPMIPSALPRSIVTYFDTLCRNCKWWIILTTSAILFHIVLQSMKLSRFLTNNRSNILIFFFKGNYGLFCWLKRTDIIVFVLEYLRLKVNWFNERRNTCLFIWNNVCVMMESFFSTTKADYNMMAQLF